MTLTHKKEHRLSVGNIVKTFDDAKGGRLKEPIYGTVTEVGEESFAVLWDDFKRLDWEAEYEWQKVTINGDEIIG